LAQAILATLAAALGVLLWFLKNRRKKTPLENINEELSKEAARTAKFKFLLQTRRLPELEEELDDQHRRLDALRLLHRKTDKANGDKDS